MEGRPLTGVRVTADGTVHRASSDAHPTVDDGGRAEAGHGRDRLQGDRIRLRAGTPQGLRRTAHGRRTRPLPHPHRRRAHPRVNDGRAHLASDEEGTVSGGPGCNDVGAGATVRDGHITLGAPATPRRVCEDSLMDAERTPPRLFGGTVAYRADSRNPALTSGDGTRVAAFATE